MARKYPSTEAVLKAIDKRIRQGVIEASRLVVDRQAARLNNVTRKWKNKVVFRPVEKRSRGVIRQQIIAEGTEKAIAIFGYVDGGTEPHMIFPKDPRKRLAFKANYSARTKPINVPNAGSGKASGPTVFSKGVMHPGTEAREFVGYTALEAEEEIQQRTAELFDRVNKE